MRITLKVKSLLYYQGFFKKLKVTAVAILIFGFTASAQTEKEKWDKAGYSFSKKTINETRDYSLNGPIMDVPVKILIDAYWVFFSEPSGDVCPYTPSCSHFFLQSVQESNIIQGSLMFFDRFTRDMNVTNRLQRYPLAKNGKLYDPVCNYLLKSDKLIYIPPYIVNK
jgi:putative component of membrane protein insertase Oxa1/YidC/SpoIIIJ protein YidD